MESTLYGIHALLLIRCKISLILQIRQQPVYIDRTHILSIKFSFLHILTSSSITITFKNGMHLRKLSSAQMPAKTQIIRLCHVKGSSRLVGPARNFHLSMLVFNALLSIMGDKISCTLCPKLKGLSGVLPTSKRE